MLSSEWQRCCFMGTVRNSRSAKLWCCYKRNCCHKEKHFRCYITGGCKLNSLNDIHVNKSKYLTWTKETQACGTHSFSYCIEHMFSNIHIFSEQYENRATSPLIFISAKSLDILRRNWVIIWEIHKTIRLHFFFTFYIFDFVLIRN